MSTLAALQVDRKDYKIGPLLFRRLWRLIRPYWFRKGSLRSWLMLAINLVSIASMGLVAAKVTFVTRDLTNALIAHDVPLYWHLFYMLIFVSLAVGAFEIINGLIAAWLNQHWRRWLTTFFVDAYLARRTYYDIVLKGGLDNPDQRIQENVAPFCSAATNIPVILLSRVTTLGVGIGVLASVTPSMLWVAVGFGVAQGVITYVVSIPTIRRNYEITVAEADLRYGILHVRDHAEAIAFYRGEGAERQQIVGRLVKVVRLHLSLLYYLAGVVSGSQLLIGTIWSVLPYAILVPIYFAGHLSYGSIAQAVGAASMILMSMAAIINFIPVLSAAAPGAIRLAQIQERFESLRPTTETSGVVIRSGYDSINIEKLNLQTPAGEQTLIRDLDIRLGRGDNLVVIGQTGVGKSSLLRAMAGLWTKGSGTISVPGSDECMFLPQRPYMILADLRSQLFYPRQPKAISDDELRAVMEAVRLPNLAKNYGGFAEVRDWGKVLSLGEQQRIGFARVLIAKPSYVFLDEATSAVDFETEAALYQLLRATGSTFVSVGHRLSILDHHTHILTILAEGRWKLNELEGGAAERAAVLFDK